MSIDYLDHEVAPSVKWERPLNALETLFASANVRFALVVTIPCSKDNNEKCEDLWNNLQQSIHVAIQSSRIGYLSLEYREDPRKETHDESSWKLVEHTTPVARLALQNAKSLAIEDPQTFLQSEVAQTSSGEGPLLIRLIRTSSGMVLTVDGNHAMVDGRSLTQLVHLATLCTPRSADDDDDDWKQVRIPDWKDLVKDALPGSSITEHGRDDVAGTTDATTMLTLAELHKSVTPQQHQSCPDQTFAFPVSIVTEIRNALKTKASPASVTGVIVAALLQSLATEYESSSTNNNAAKPKDIGISTLVDLRPYIQQQSQYQGSKTANPLPQIPQIHGTVTLVERSDMVLELSTLKLARQMTLQLHRRIQRGEAHRASLAMTTGNFGQLPASTMELSNLGVCQLGTDGSALWTAQRFDEYDGVSCMVHSESFLSSSSSTETGMMRWTVSVGNGIDAETIRRVFVRASNLFQAVASNT